MTSLSARPATLPLARPYVPFLDRIVLIYAAAWIVFLIGGFRLPWEPIPLDEDATFSTRRQAMFTIGALLAVHRLVQCGRFSRSLADHLPWLAISAFLCGSLLWSTDHVLTAKRSIVHLFGALMLFGVVDTSERPMRFFLRTAVFAVGACAWISLIQERVWPADCWSIPWRPGLAGLAGHPNVLGPCMQMGCLLSLAIRPESPGERLALRVLQLGLAIALWRTDSMTSLTSTIVGTSVWVVLRAHSYRAGLIQIAAVFAFGVVMAIGMDSVKGAFFSATGRDETLSGRDELWRVVHEHASDRPLLGTGFGAFWYKNRGLELVHTWNPKQAHHAWIDVIAETGYVGLFFVILLVPFRMVPWWQRHAGPRGSAQRDAVAAIYASTIVLLGMSAFSESFLLRMDKLQWFLTAWALMLFENTRRNRIGAEYGTAAA